MTVGSTVGPAIGLRGVFHTFAPKMNGAMARPVLWDVSFTLEYDRVIGVVGESGCGKTTLGRIAAGLLRPSTGDVDIAGVDPYRADREAWLALRRDVRMIFQSPAAALNPFLKVRELCEEPIRVHESHVDRRLRRLRIEELSQKFDFCRLDQYPRSLSGGEKRRASLVRAMAVPFRVLVADEPTSGLDTALEVQILGTIERFRREWKAGMLLISHHLGIVEMLADEILVLYAGNVVEAARNGARRFDGIHPYTKDLWHAARLEFSERAAAARVAFGNRTEKGCVYQDMCRIRPSLGEAQQDRCRAECPVLRPVDGMDGHHKVACHHFDA